MRKRTSSGPRPGHGTGSASNGPFVDNEREAHRRADEATHGGGRRNAKGQGSRDHAQNRTLDGDGLPDDKARMDQGTRVGPGD